MTKPVMQDVVPPDRRSIRNVTLPKRQELKDEPIQRVPVHDHTPEEKADFSVRMEEQLPPPHTIRRIAMWTLALGALLFLVGTVMMVFASAEVIVKPRVADLSADIRLTADPSGSPESLPYQALTLPKTLSSNVAATGQTFVSKKSSGTITIYNNFSSAPQRLVKNTRFETPQGIIFRVESSVTIPGQTKKDGVSVPGSVEAVVVADEAGPQYNIGPSDFSIPGFKNDPVRYKGFYARSIAPTTGGFLGNMPTVDPVEAQQKAKELEERMTASLKRDIEAAIPEGFKLFPGAVVIATSSLPTEVSPEGGASIGLAATATAYLIPEARFASEVAMAGMGESYDGLPVRIEDYDTVIFGVERFPSADNPTMAISVKGQIGLVWEYDEEELKSALIGQHKSRLGEIIGRFKGLEEDSSVTIRPFFKRTFPSTPSRITILIDGEKP